MLVRIDWEPDKVKEINLKEGYAVISVEIPCYTNQQFIGKIRSIPNDNPADFSNGDNVDKIKVKGIWINQRGTIGAK